jgi:hypothetical protein
VIQSNNKQHDVCRDCLHAVGHTIADRYRRNEKWHEVLSVLCGGKSIDERECSGPTATAFRFVSASRVFVTVSPALLPLFRRCSCRFSPKQINLNKYVTHSKMLGFILDIIARITSKASSRHGTHVTARYALWQWSPAEQRHLSSKLVTAFMSDSRPTDRLVEDVKRIVVQNVGS